MRTSVVIAAVAASFVQALEDCPDCYTKTVTVVPPCAPRLCTGTTATVTDCSQTVYTNAGTTTVESTVSLAPINPMCTYTPTSTYQLGCPSAEACVVSSCASTSFITVAYTVTLLDVTTTQPPPLVCSITGPGVPSPTPTVIVAPSDVTPPPPFSLIPDPCEFGECE